MITTVNTSKKSQVTTKEEALELVQLAFKHNGEGTLKTVNVFFWNDGKIDVDVSWKQENDTPTAS